MGKRTRVGGIDPIFSRDLGAVNEQLIDMERAFAQFHREDAVTQAPEFEYLHSDHYVRLDVST